MHKKLVKLGFYLLYNHLSWSYEAVAWLVSFGQWSDWRRLALNYLQPGPTLELAYGTGVLFVDMLQAGHRPVGIDLSPYMARQSVRRLQQYGYPSRLSRASAEAAPFPDNCFANIVATFPSDYIFQPRTLAEIHRILHPKGRLIVVAEGVLRGPRPLRALVDWLYKITDQRSIPPKKPFQLLAAHNLDARWKIAEQGEARARLLLATVKK